MCVILDWVHLLLSNCICVRRFFHGKRRTLDLFKTGAVFERRLCRLEYPSPGTNPSFLGGSFTGYARGFCDILEFDSDCRGRSEERRVGKECAI